MIVYRIEHKELRVGPYDFKYHIDNQNYCQEIMKIWPNMFQESKRTPVFGKHSYINPLYFFGFKKRKDIKRWFLPKTRKILHKYGFVISWYEIDDYHVVLDSTHLAFKLHLAKMIKQEYIVKSSTPILESISDVCP